MGVILGLQVLAVLASLAAIQLVEGKKLSVTHLTRSYVEASYGNESVGVRFSSATGNLTVRSLSGEILLMHASYNGGYRYVTLFFACKIFHAESLGDVPVTQKFAVRFIYRKCRENF